jgi:hypothetical protein
MIKNKPKRENWWVKNVSNKILTIGDLPHVPSFGPGQTHDVLRYATLEQVGQSKSLVFMVKRGWLTLTKDIEGEQNIVETANIGDAITGAQDEEVKTQVDNVLKIKDEVRVATVSDITLSGTQTIDGISLSVGERVLVKDQDDATENGIYNVASSTWSRSDDSDTIDEIRGTVVYVSEGTVNAGSTWAIAEPPVTLDSSDIIFAVFTKTQSLTAGAGLTRSGTTIDVVGTSNRILVNPDSINISPNYVGQTSITTVGTITNGNWAGTTIPLTRGGTGATSAITAKQSLGTVFSQVVIIDSNYTVLPADDGKFFNVDTSGGNITITLPLTNSVSNGFGVSIRKADTSVNTVTVTPSSGETINHEDNRVLHYQSQVMSIISTSNEWLVGQFTLKIPVSVASGGTGMDGTSSGGTGQFVKQTSNGGNFSVGTISTSELPSAISATKIGDGSVSNTEFGHLNGVTSDIQDQIDDRPAITDNIFSTAQRINVKLNPGEGEYDSVVDAMASISDSSSSKPYIIVVGPGVYTESQIVMKPYTSITGSGEYYTVLQPSNPDENFILTSHYTHIGQILLTGVTGSGRAAIYHESPDSNASQVTIQDVRFGNNYCFVEAYGQTSRGNANVFVFDCTYGQPYQFTRGFYAHNNSNSVRAQIFVAHSQSTFGFTATLPEFFGYATGDGCQFVTNGVQVRTAGLSTGSCIKVGNGARLRLLSTNIEGWAKGIEVLSGGIAPSLVASGINFENNTQDVLVSHSSATGNIMGNTTKNKVNLGSSSVFLFGMDSHIIRVAKSGSADYTSIKTAMESITDSSSTNRYIIKIGPGIYTEDTIDMKSFVVLCGESQFTSIVSPSAPGISLFTNTNATGQFVFQNMTFANATGSGTTLDFTGSTNGGFGFLDCTFVSGYDAIRLTSVNGPQTMSIAGLFLQSVGNYNTVLYAQDNGTNEVAVNIHRITSASLLSGETSGNKVLFASGSKTTIRADGIQCVRSTVGGTAITAQNGADVTLRNCQFKNYTTAVHIPNTGTGPEVNVVATVIRDCDTDLLIENPGATGTFSGEFTLAKIEIDPSADVALNVLDPEETGIIITGDIIQGSSFNSATNVTVSLQKSTNIGSNSSSSLAISGRNVTLSAGYGYVYSGDIPNEVLKYVEWDEQTITIPANTFRSLSVNSDGVFTATPTGVDVFKNIIIGRGRTTSSNFVLFQGTVRNANYTATRIEDMLTRAVGALYVSGSIASENGITSRAIDVTSGVYYVATTRFAPSGGTAITFNTFYRNGSGDYTIGSASVVDNTHYDNASGTLATIPDGKYVKHALYLNSDANGENGENYYLVFGQEVFDTLVDAQAGGIPIAPNFFGTPTPLIASIILQKSGTHFEQVRDNRPTLGFKAEGVSATSVHGNLSGLNADDHPQYLLADGSRSLSGVLNLGTNNITNAGTINGISLSAHSSRHLPNGADALPTDAPDTNLSATSENSEGIQNKFSRSDHTHAIDASSTNTASSLVKRDGNGDFSAGIITADLVGDVTGNASSCTDFSGSLVGDVIGTQGATAIASGVIVNADINATAGIVDTKLATIATSGKVSNSATTATALNTASAIVARNASGNFAAGTITANLTGNVTGNVTGNLTGNADTATSATSATSATTATTATNFSGSLTGDVTGTQGATVLANSVVTNAKISNSAGIVDTKLATIATAGKVSNSATTATALNTASAIVARDGSGNFVAGTITANLIGNVTGNVTGNADTVTTNANLTGDVTSVGNATAIASGVIVNADINATAGIVDTKLAQITTSGKVANSATTATALNTASAIVTRDGSGNFVAGTITANLTGNASGTAATFTGSLTGDVTSTAMATTIVANAVTNAKAAQMATLTIKGNNTGVTANPIDLSVTQTTAMLNAFVGDSGSGGTKGLVPAPASGDTAALKFLKANGSWSALPSPAATQTTPADPAVTTSLTAVMMGLAGTITPSVTGNILITISGDIDNATNSRGSIVQMRTGTGTAPINGAASAGTARGGAVNFFQNSGVTRAPFSLNCVLTGQTLNTAIWIDVALNSVTGGSSRIRNISISAVEI